MAEVPLTCGELDFPLTNPVLTFQAMINIATYSCTNPRILVPQQGSSIMIDGLDCETQDVVYRNSHLYTAFADLHNWGSGTVEAVRYLKINVSSNSAVIDAEYGADGYYYFDPNIYVDAYDNIVMVFSRSSGNEYAGVRWTYRNSSDAAARASESLQDGFSSYTSTYGMQDGYMRWGDYSGICLDASNDNQLWFCGEYALTQETWGNEIGSCKFVPVQFVNSVGGSQAVGNIKVNSNLTLSSGSSAHLGLGSGNTELTLAQGGSNQDRFTNTNNVPLAKHNNWDNTASWYQLNNGFTVTGKPSETQTAYFIPLNPATITTTVDGAALTNINLLFNDPWYLNSNGTQGNNLQASTPIISNSAPMRGAYNQSSGGVFITQSAST